MKLSGKSNSFTSRTGLSWQPWSVGSLANTPKVPDIRHFQCSTCARRSNPPLDREARKPQTVTKRKTKWNLSTGFWTILNFYTKEPGTNEGIVATKFRQPRIFWLPLKFASPRNSFLRCRYILHTAARKPWQPWSDSQLITIPKSRIDKSSQSFVTIQPPIFTYFKNTNQAHFRYDCIFSLF